MQERKDPNWLFSVCISDVSAWLSDKESTCQAGDAYSISELGRSPGEGNGNPLQYYCLGDPLERGAWWVIVHGVTKTW